LCWKDLLNLGPRQLLRAIISLNVTVARQLYTGAGTVRSFSPGTHFVLSGQADLSTLLEEPPEDERRYILLRVVHLAHNNLSADLRAVVDQRLGGEQKEASGITAKSASGAGTTSASSYLFNSMQEALKETLGSLSGSDHRVKIKFHWQRDAAGQYGSHSRQVVR